MYCRKPALQLVRLVYARKAYKHFNLQHFHFKKCDTTISVILQFLFPLLVQIKKYWLLLKILCSLLSVQQSLIFTKDCEIVYSSYLQKASELCYLCCFYFFSYLLFHKKILDAFIFRQLIITEIRCLADSQRNLQPSSQPWFFEQELASRFHLLSSYDLILIMSKGFISLHSYITARFSLQVRLRFTFYISKFIYLCVY